MMIAVYKEVEKMTFQMRDRWNIPVTAVADEFIDHYMAAANGEYVKVYLYILRHQSEPVDVEAIADALNHTESDVRRALAYWEKAGVLSREETGAAGAKAPEGFPADAAVETAAGAERGFNVPGGRTVDVNREAAPGLRESVAGGRTAAADDFRSQGTAFSPGQQPAAPSAPYAPYSGQAAPATVSVTAEMDGMPGAGMSGAGIAGTGIAAAGMSGAISAAPAIAASAIQPSPASDAPKPVYSVAQVNRLSGDEEFAQILYIAQKYMNKVFTPRDCQVFAYLYDTLKFSPELLEYLVEYCVQNGHVSVRYMETVALNWHEQGFKTPDEAKEYAQAFNSDAFSVMKAFGLNDRRPGTEEQRMITKWFKEYGFGRELVLLACNRTISAIHNPSFRYADKILSDWKAAGVHTRADVDALDEKRAKSRTQAGGNAASGGRAAGAQGGGSADGGRKKSSNQFHNFKQRDTDYDALVLKQLKERVGRQ